MELCGFSISARKIELSPCSAAFKLGNLDERQMKATGLNDFYMLAQTPTNGMKLAENNFKFGI